ncbi:hypothetical protein ACSMX9_12660 [Streptomyces sp. LE64]|uniref:hypothetical protein n=1 Tax=Streptomyces sp. LE64 TaxID=3448653 RepID=UPI0040438E81
MSAVPSPVGVGVRPARPCPRPGAGWATVCFRGPGRGGGLDTRTTGALWRTPGGHGPALVRVDAVAAGCRHPAACRHPSGRFPCDVHLWVDTGSPALPRLGEHADVLVSRGPLAPASARRRVSGLLARYAGCSTAVVPGPDRGGCLVGVRTRDGGVEHAVLECGGRGPVVPVHLAAAVVHAWVVSGRPLGALCAVSPLPRR